MYKNLAKYNTEEEEEQTYIDLSSSLNIEDRLLAEANWRFDESTYDVPPSGPARTVVVDAQPTGSKVLEAVDPVLKYEGVTEPPGERIYLPFVSKQKN
jgi:hypothetical protein